jgi:hypothetical protein
MAAPLFGDMQDSQRCKQATRAAIEINYSNLLEAVLCASNIRGSKLCCVH